MRKIDLSKKPFAPGLTLLLATAGAIIIAAGCARIASLAEPKPSPELKEAKIFLDSGDRQNALAKFDAAIAANPKEPRVYSNVMHIGAHARDDKVVERYYRQGVEATANLSNDERATVHIGAGYAYLYLRKFEPAILANRKALELSPDNVHALNGLGYSYAEADKNLDEAVKLTSRAITLAREKQAGQRLIGAIVDSLGWAYFKLKRFDDALKTLAEAASLAPDMGEIQYHLGLAYEKKGRLADARVALARAHTLEPEMDMFRQALDRVTAELQARGELRVEPNHKPDVKSSTP